LEISGGELGTIEVKLYDVVGRCVKTIFSGKKTQERMRFETDMSEMATGMYIYAITLQGIKQQHIKFLKF
jgi:hypothetical protein